MGYTEASVAVMVPWRGGVRGVSGLDDVISGHPTTRYRGLDCLHPSQNRTLLPLENYPQPPAGRLSVSEATKRRERITSDRARMLLNFTQIKRQ